MGYFDGLTANLLQTGTDGQRYYAPAGKLGPLYQVPNEEAAIQLRREWRAFFIAFFVVLMAGLSLAGPGWVATAGWRLLLAAPLGGIAAVGFGFVAARRLPRATISHSELVRVPRAQAHRTYATAMGRRTLRFVLGTSLFMTVVGLLVAVLTPSVTLWISAGFFALCTVSIYRAYRSAS
jgi:hypothetical protein